MVDVERVVRLLDGIRHDIGRLRGLTPEGEAALDAIKYRFITAIEGAARVAHHLAVSEGWATPESNADAFTILSRKEVITADLARRLAEAAGFRNLLVHQYADVDDQKVVANLDRLGDLDEYVRQLGDWVVGQSDE